MAIMAHAMYGYVIINNTLHSLFLCLSVCRSLSLSPSLALFLSLSLSLSLSFSLTLSLSLTHSLSLSLSFSLSLSHSLSVQKGLKPLFCTFEINPQVDMLSHLQPQVCFIHTQTHTHIHIHPHMFYRELLLKVNTGREPGRLWLWNIVNGGFSICRNEYVCSVYTYNFLVYM